MRMTPFEKLFVNRQRKGLRNAETVKRLLQEVDSSQITDVLEIGCGIGTVSATLAHTHGARVVGTDLDPEEIELARSLYKETEDLRFRVEDVTNLSFADDSFDLVVSQMVFHHIPQWRRAVCEIVRVLRTGGFLLWQDLVFPSWLTKWLLPIVRNYGLYTLEQVSAEFTIAGFTQRYCERERHGPFVHYYMILEKHQLSVKQTAQRRN